MLTLLYGYFEKSKFNFYINYYYKNLQYAKRINRQINNCHP